MANTDSVNSFRKSTMVLPTRPLGKFKRAVLLTMAKILPSHSKRLIFWSSLYGELCIQRSIDEPSPKRLNEIMGLATDANAAILPIKLGNVIWRDSTKCISAVTEALQGKCIAKCFTDFLDGIPKVLRYASERFIRDDFESIIAAHRHMHRTAT